jgi:hypothetical protein
MLPVIGCGVLTPNRVKQAIMPYSSGHSTCFLRSVLVARPLVSTERFSARRDGRNKRTTLEKGQSEPQSIIEQSWLSIWWIAMIKERNT